MNSHPDASKNRNLGKTRITYHAPSRVFDRLFNEESLDELQNVVRRKLGLNKDAPVVLAQLRDGMVIDLEDDEDFDAFYDRAQTATTIDVRVTTKERDPSVTTTGDMPGRQISSEAAPEGHSSTSKQTLAVPQDLPANGSVHTDETGHELHDLRNVAPEMPSKKKRRASSPEKSGPDNSAVSSEPRPKKRKKDVVIVSSGGKAAEEGSLSENVPKPTGTTVVEVVSDVHPASQVGIEQKSVTNETGASPTGDPQLPTTDSSSITVSGPASMAVVVDGSTTLPLPVEAPASTQARPYPLASMDAVQGSASEQTGKPKKSKKKKMVSGEENTSMDVDAPEQSPSMEPSPSGTMSALVVQSSILPSPQVDLSLPAVVNRKGSGTTNDDSTDTPVAEQAVDSLSANNTKPEKKGARKAPGKKTTSKARKKTLRSSRVSLEAGSHEMDVDGPLSEKSTQKHDTRDSDKERDLSRKMDKASTISEIEEAVRASALRILAASQAFLNNSVPPTKNVGNNDSKSTARPPQEMPGTTLRSSKSKQKQSSPIIDAQNMVDHPGTSTAATLDNSGNPEPTHQSTASPAAQTKPKSANVSCPLCLQTRFHLRYECPVVIAGPESMLKCLQEIRLDGSPDRKQIIEELESMIHKSRERSESEKRPSHGTVNEQPLNSSQILQGTSMQSQSEVSPNTATAPQDNVSDSDTDFDGSEMSGTSTGKAPQAGAYAKEDTIKSPAPRFTADDLEAVIRGPRRRLTVADIVSPSTSSDEDDSTEVILEEDKEDNRKSHRYTKHKTAESSDDETQGEQVDGDSDSSSSSAKTKRLSLQAVDLLGESTEADKTGGAVFSDGTTAIDAAPDYRAVSADSRDTAVDVALDKADPMATSSLSSTSPDVKDSVNSNLSSTMNDIHAEPLSTTQVLPGKDPLKPHREPSPIAQNGRAGATDVVEEFSDQDCHPSPIEPPETPRTSSQPLVVQGAARRMKNRQGKLPTDNQQAGCDPSIGAIRDVDISPPDPSSNRGRRNVVKKPQQKSNHHKSTRSASTKPPRKTGRKEDEESRTPTQTSTQSDVLPITGGDISIVKWTVLETSSQVDSSVMLDELQPSSPLHVQAPKLRRIARIKDTTKGREPLFIPSDSQPPFSQSQTFDLQAENKAEEDSPSAIEEEREVEHTVKAARSQSSEQSSTGPYRRLTEIASQQTVFANELLKSSTPKLRSVRMPDMKAMYGLNAREEEEESSSSSEDSDAPPSHIPPSRRAGASSKQ